MDARILRRLSCSAVVVSIPAAVWLGCGDTEPLASGGTSADDSGASTNLDTGMATPTDANGGNIVEAGVDGAAQGLPITYGTCAAFAKCGGPLPGTWTVSGGCLSSSIFKVLKDNCDGFVESDIDIRARGTITFTDTTVARDTTVDVSGKALVPKSCAPIPAAQCAAIQGLLTAGIQGYPKFDTAKCTDVPADGGGACACVFAGTIAEQSTDTYTSTAEGTITATNSQTKYDYCVTGNKMAFQDGTAEAKRLPLTIEVSK